MTAQKPDKSVAGMDVLNDIRGLLSNTKESASGQANAANQPNLSAEISRLHAEIASYKAFVQKQNEELDELKSRRNAQAVEPVRTVENSVRTKDAAGVGEELGEEIALLEQRKAELSSALSDIEGLLQLKTKDLLRQIARVYDEAGQSDIALEFRRAGNQLQDTDKFASFLRALLND